MSVAMGIPQPTRPSPDVLNRRYMRAGVAIPPTAATTGRAAFLNDDNSPWSSSRFISRPTTKKKTAIRPSFTRCPRSSEMAKIWMSKET